MAFDAAGLTDGEGLHAKFDEAVLAEQPLPAFGRRRRIDTACRTAGGVSGRAIGAGAVARARHPQRRRQRIQFDGVGKTLRNIAGSAAGTVDRATGVIDDVRARALEARGVAFDHQPVHEREHFVETGVAVQVGVIEEAEAAIAVADVGRNQRQARLVGLRHAVASGAGDAITHVHERAGVKIRPPLGDGEHDRVPYARSGAADSAALPRDVNRRDQAIEHDVIPLIEHRQLVVADRNAGEYEIAIRVALGEGDIGVIGRAHAHVAIREAVVGVVATAEDALVGRAAHVRVRNAAEHVLRAAQAAAAFVDAGHDTWRVTDAGVSRIILAGIDDVAIGKANRDVETAGTELLEVPRLVGLDEGFEGRATVKGIGLQPFLATRDAIGARTCERLVEARVQVGDHRLTDQG